MSVSLACVVSAFTGVSHWEVVCTVILSAGRDLWTAPSRFIYRQCSALGVAMLRCICIYIQTHSILYRDGERTVLWLAGTHRAVGGARSIMAEL